MSGETFKGPASGTQPGNHTLRLERLYANNDPSQAPTLVGIGPNKEPVGAMNTGFNSYLLHAQIWVVYVGMYSGKVPNLTVWTGGTVNNPTRGNEYVTLLAQPGTDKYGFNFQSLSKNGDYGDPTGLNKSGYLVEYNYPAGSSTPNVDRTEVQLKQVTPPDWLSEYPQPAWTPFSWHTYVDIPGEWFLDFSASDHLVPPFCAEWSIPTGGYAILPASGAPDRLWKNCNTPTPSNTPSQLVPYYLGGGGLLLLLGSFFLGNRPGETSAANALRAISVLLIASSAALAVALDIKTG